MEEQTNQIQPQAPQPTVVSPTVEKVSETKTRFPKKIIISVFILLVLLIGIALVSINYKNNNKLTKLPNQKKSNVKIIYPDLTTKGVKIAFLRNENLYLYQDGKERLVESITIASKSAVKRQLQYPIVSPNGKFLAYIDSEITDKNPEYPGAAVNGKLKIINLQNNKTIITNYKIFSYEWNNLSQIEFLTSNVIVAKDTTKYSYPINVFSGNKTYRIFDPAYNKEIDSLTVSVDEDGLTGYSGFPIKGDKKVIYKNKLFYLLDRNGDEKNIGIGATDTSFDSWSTSGKFLIFSGYASIPSTHSAYFIINSENLGENMKEIPITWGGAGGEAGAGPKWYFDNGFVPDCSEQLFFTDNKTQIQLTETHGGGCNNSEGFVSTSPDGKFALVKFNNRFEIHSINGDKKNINELIPIKKSRFTPKNIFWIGNNYAIMFESTSYQRIIGEPSNNKIYLYNLKTNVIKPIIDNAYLASPAFNI